MVTATRGVTGDGRVVGEANPQPLWGLILAAMSGFDGERLWRLYRFVPWLSLLCLGCAVAFFSDVLGEREQLQRGTLPGLATFFVLFLSSHRLSFHEPESTFWSESFWSTPQLGIALAALCLFLRWLADNSLAASIAAVVSFAFVGWMDPRLALLLAAGALPWLIGERMAPGSRTGLGSCPFLSFSRCASPDRFARNFWKLVRRGQPHLIGHRGSRARFSACRHRRRAFVALRPASRNSSRNVYSRRPRSMDARVLFSRHGANARSPHAQRVGAYATLGDGGLWTLSRAGARGLALSGASRRVGLRTSELAPALRGAGRAIGLLSSFPPLVFSLLVDARSHGSDLRGKRRAALGEPSIYVGRDP